MIFDLFTIITDTGVVDIVLTPLDSTAGKLAALNAVDTLGQRQDRHGQLRLRDRRPQRRHRPPGRGHGRLLQQALVLPRPQNRHSALARQHHRPRPHQGRQVRGLHGHPHLRLAARRTRNATCSPQLRATELAHRKIPLELLYVTPQTGVAPEPFDDYDIGDLVTVNLGTVFGPAVVSGVQRVYGFDVDLDTDGVERVSELMVSARGFDPPEVPGEPVDPDDPGEGITKPVYPPTKETRLSGLERKTRFLERRSQIPAPKLADDEEAVVDSTENVGDEWGVHSAGEADGAVLTADGAGGSIWTPPDGGGGDLSGYIHYGVNPGGEIDHTPDGTSTLEIAAAEMELRTTGELSLNSFGSLSGIILDTGRTLGLSGGQVSINGTSYTTLLSTIILMPYLPTGPPEGSGCLWRDAAGHLRIT